ncbi:phylloplanin-like isoform X1 [Carex rostrata]
MAVKIYVVLTMLVFAGVVPPLAHAQLGLGNIVGLLTGLLSVTGIVPCSVGNSINLSTTGFANATVQLRCNNNVVGSTTTDAKGAFTIDTVLPITLLSNLLGCNVFVATPLVTCNASLSSAGNLVAQLEGIFTSILGVTNLVTGNFTVQQTIT